MRLITKLVCLFKGHASLERHVTETKFSIRTERCSRCKAPIGQIVLKLKHIPPPCSDPQQIIDWEKYCDEQEEAARCQDVNYLINKG